MALTVGTGPFGQRPGGTFNFELAAAPGSGATGGLSVSAGTFSAKF